MAAFYGVQPSPVDDSIWGQSMDVGFSRIDQPGYIIRLMPGREPGGDRARRSLSCRPTRATARAASTSTSTAWCGRCCRAAMWRASTAASARGRSTARRRPPASMCPEGWTLYQFPGPQFKGVTDPGSADHAYYIWVDRYNTLGLGANVPIASTNGGESLARARRRQVRRRCAFPIRWASSARTSTAASTIRTPAGRAAACGRRSARAPCSTTKAARRARRSVFKLQMRPDPLAH